MKTKAIIASVLVSTAILAGTAYANPVTVNFNRPWGYFYCTVDADDNTPVSISTTHAYVKGPSTPSECQVGVLHTTVKELKQYAYAWYIHGINPRATIKVEGDAKSLVCNIGEDGRPTAPGQYCVVPTKK